MMLMLQAAAPVQPITVTLQQPPGLPFWETAVISALVGTFFGLASGVLMELLKPQIAKGLLKRLMLRHLDSEFRLNYATYLDALDIVKRYDSATGSDKEIAAAAVESIGRVLSRDRYNHFSEREKTAVYELDCSFPLTMFYVTFAKGCAEFPSNRGFLLMAEGPAQAYIKMRGIGEVKPFGWFAKILDIAATTAHSSPS